MGIKSITIHKCNRLMYANITTLRYTPEQKIQVLLGTNGSGKSTLLNELTQLPPDKDDYFKDGYKELHGTVDNVEYTLLSDFRKKKPHSFIYDGIELNPGGTVTIQIRLVKEKFNITPKIHSLLTGQTLFTNMSIPDRKEWFTMMSDTDYDYAINKYNKFKNKYRDISGTIKTLSKRWLVEKETKLDDKETKILLDKIKYLNIKLDTLLDNKTKVSELDKRNIDDEIVDLCEIINYITKTSYKGNKQLHLDTLLSELSTNIKELNLAKFTVDNYSKDILDIERKLKSIGVSSSRLLTDLDEELRVHIETSKKLSSVLLHDICIPDINSVKEVYYSIRPILEELSDEYIETYTDVEITTDKTILTDTINKLTTDLQLTTNKLKKLLREDDLCEHSYKQNNITCPKCENVWKLGYDKDKHSKLKRLISKLSNNDLDSKLKRYTEQLNKVIAKENIKRSIHEIILQNKLLTPLWNKITKGSDIQELMVGFRDFHNDIELHERLHIINKEISNIKDEQVKSTNTNYSTVLELEKSLEDIGDLHSLSVANVHKHEDEIKSIENNIKTIKKLNKLTNDLNKLVSDKEDINIVKYNHIKLKYSNSLINLIRVEITKLETKYHESLNKNAVIDDINNQIKILSEKENILKTIMNELSPVDGLIAEGILGFMRVFLDKLNSVIATIWTYPLEVLPCSMDNETISLSYRFPVNCDNGKITKDVSKTSSGMKEIINLAFKITAMKCLGLDTYSLYLDEFGNTMDSKHRRRANDVISNIFAYSEFDKIFIVSHFIESYGTFANTDINILSEDNIDMVHGVPHNEVLNLS